MWVRPGDVRGRRRKAGEPRHIRERGRVVGEHEGGPVLRPDRGNVQRERILHFGGQDEHEHERVTVVRRHRRNVERYRRIVRGVGRRERKTIFPRRRG